MLKDTKEHRKQNENEQPKSDGDCGAVGLTGLIRHAAANDVPLNLSRPDGKPGDVTKPVKVYILAGQSNMVGMGDLTGARPPWPSVFLSADPAIIPGIMPIGGSAIARHGVFDAKATVYSGKQPVKTVTVALGTVAEKLPAIDGPHTVVVDRADRCAGNAGPTPCTPGFGTAPTPS